ncbi:MAG TPA: hypothetical protein VFA12_20245 [Stellaceae bacterium]|nr:hypothetical protein [Stellaceae bacterium]
MADLVDVCNALKSIALTALGIPSGGGLSTVVPNTLIAIGNGWPTEATLNGIAASYSAANPQALISIYPVPNGFRNLTRNPAKWQELSRPTATLTITVAGDTLTIGGAAPGANGAVQNVAAIVGFGTAYQGFVYQTTPSDTLNTIAASLAALINAATPASAVGEVITIPAAFSIIGRIGVTGTAIREISRQAQMVDLHVWTPTPALRDQIGIPLRQALSAQFTAGCIEWVTLADGSGMRITMGADHWLDDPEKANLYRRIIGVECDYATTQTIAAAEIIVMESQTEMGNSTLGTAPSITFTN